MRQGHICILSWGWLPKFSLWSNLSSRKWKICTTSLKNQDVFFLHFFGQCSFLMFCQEKTCYSRGFMKKSWFNDIWACFVSDCDKCWIQERDYNKVKIFHNKIIQNIQQRCWFFYKIRNTFNHSNCQVWHKAWAAM